MGIGRVLCGMLAIASVAAADAGAATREVPGSYPTIQAAIDASANGDVVVIAPGTYRGPGNRAIDYKGKLLTVRSMAPDDPNVVAATVVDCERQARGFYFHTSETAAAVLDGLTFTNGSADLGAGVYCYGASPTIQKCLIVANVATSSSGGIYLSQSNATVRDCWFVRNNTGNTSINGGGLCVGSGNATITGCVFVGNQAYTGGGLYCSGTNGVVQVSDCTFVANTAAFYGGGVYCSSSGTTITNCRLTGNSARYGGGVVIASSSPLVTNCTITGNTATAYGGGIYATDASAKPTITHCTITGNSATTGGGGIRCESAVPVITSCILWGDAPQEISVNGTGPTVAYCDVQGSWTGTGNINVDPLLAMLSDPHLMRGSPCVDAGTLTPAGGLPATDAEGKARPQDGDGDGNALPDIGAYESVGGIPCIAACPHVLEFVRPAEGADPPAKSLTIRNCGAGTLSWRIEGMCSWLQVTPATGVSDGEAVPVTMRTSAGALAPGDYACTLTITDPQAANNPRTVQVWLRVGQTRRVPTEYPNIRSAINCARDGDSVVIADGTYRGGDNHNLTTLGKAITIRSENGPATCILDCQGQDSTKGFTISSKEGPDTVIDGLTFKDSYYYSFGRGVIDCTGTSPTIRNCRFVWTIILDHSPAIYCEGGSPTITGCTIRGLKLFGPDAASGGTGIVCNAASPTITDCEITDMVSGGGAGAVSVSNGGNPRITNCVFRGNQASLGGGVRVDASRVTLVNTRIEENSATSDGGGVYAMASSEVILANCRILRNSAVDHGGGICLGDDSYVSTSVLNAVSTLVCGNQAKFGGGIYAYQRGSGGRVSLTHCTIARNAAVFGPGASTGSVEGSEGGGVSCYCGDLLLTNCIAWGNTAATGPSSIICGSDYEPIATAGFSYCDIEGGRAGILIVGTPSRLQLTWGGGNIDRAPEFAFADDYHLLPGSACLDAGTNTPPGGLPATDVEGNARAIDGKGTGVPVADIGAYEYDPQAPSIAVSPAVAQFQAIQEGPNPPDQTLMVRNVGGGTLYWTITESCDWLEVLQTAGQSTGEISEVTLRVNVAGLTPGPYTCTLTIADPQASNLSATVRVLLRYNAVLHMPGPYRTIQGAIDSTTQDGDVVVVGDGAWTGVGMKNLTFRNRGITVRSANGPDHCTIDCENNGSGFLPGYFTGPPGTIDGFTITRASDSGIKVAAGSPTIRNCRLIGNSTTVSGGGITSTGGAGTITGCEIRANTSTYDGGGVYGGFTLTDCTISWNTSNRDGGGVFGAMGVFDCVISDNRAVGNAGGAGNLSATGLVRCRILRNSALRGGGAYQSALSGCEISDNVATDMGGGLYAQQIVLKVANCRFLNNHADARGGGIAMKWIGERQTICNCTFRGNSAGSAGGAIHRFGSTIPGGATKVVDCVFWEDSAPQGAEISIADDQDNGLSVRYCDVAGGQAGIYRENGGRLTWGEGNQTTAPIFVNAATGDYHLGPASPCIDAGDPASDYSLEPQPNGGRINMGAYGNTAEAETRGWLYIEGYVQVRKTRIGRTTFEYEFSITMRNAGTMSADSVVAEILQVPSGVQIVEGTVSVGLLPAGATVVSQDTFTIRLDRLATSSIPITWRVTYTAGISEFAAVLDLMEPGGTSADLDGDGDVDMADFAAFQRCFNGPNQPAADADCEKADASGDGDVDMEDFARFQACFNGPNLPAACE